MAEDENAPRRHAIQRESICQKHARLWCREAIAAPHKFLAFDRSKASGRMTHLRERNRGITAGTPDTLLRLEGFRNIWVEFKSPGEKPSDTQYDLGDELASFGDHWFWVTTVFSYYATVREIGVPLHPNAEFLALHHDGSVASEIARAELAAGKAPKSYKPRARAPTVGQVRRAAKAGAWG